MQNRGKEKKNQGSHKEEQEVILRTERKEIGFNRE